MAFQQARPYDTGPGALSTMYDIQRLVAGDQRNRLGDMEFQQGQQKAIRADTAYQAQQKLLDSIADPQQRLAALYAPDKFAASVFRDPKDRYLPDGRGGLWDLEAPNGPSLRGGPRGYTDMNGNPIGPGGGGQAPAPGQQPAAPAAGGPGGALDIPGFRTARRRFEGGTSGSAPPNPNSTAQGPDQFIESTWERLMLSKGRPFIDMKIGPNANLNDPNVKAAIQALRNDEEVSGAMAEAYAEENAAELQSAGIQPTNRNLVVAHFLGGSGAKRFLSADPNAPAAQHVDPAAVNANRSVFFDKETGRARTVQEVLAEVDRRTGEVTGQQPGQGYAQASGGASGELEPIYNDDGKFDTNFGKDPVTGRVKRYPSSAQTQVNIGDKTGDKVGTEQRWKSFGVLRDRAEVAGKLEPKLAMLREQLTQLEAQGPGSNALYKVVGTAQNLARSMGVDQQTIDQYSQQLAGIDTKSVEGAALANKLIQDFVTTSLRSAFAGMGSTTDQDMAAILQSNASLENPLAANLALIDKVFAPALQRDRQLWNRVRPLQRTDRELIGLDDEVAAFEEEWNRTHYPPKAPEDPNAATDTVPNPTVQQPSAEITEQQAKAFHPGAIPLKSGGWAAPDPTSATGYRRITIK